MDCPACYPLLTARTMSNSAQPDGRHMLLSNTLDLRCCASHYRAVSDSYVMSRNSV